MITAMPRIAIATNQFEQIVTTFRHQLGMPVIDMSSTSLDSLGAKLGMAVPSGGSNIELMCPAQADAPLSQSLQRFIDRRAGFFALMLEAPDPDEEAQRLIAQGLNVLPLMAGAGGRDIHPNSTHGVLIRIYPVNSFNRQMDETPESAGLSGIAQVMIAVRDLQAAGAVYGGKLGLPIDAASSDEARTDAQQGTQSITCRPPAGGAIELISPLDTERPFAARLAQHLSDHGEGIYAVVLHSADMSATADLLTRRGLTVTETDIGLEISPQDTFGARIFIEAS